MLDLSTNTIDCPYPKLRRNLQLHVYVAFNTGLRGKLEPFCDASIQTYK